MKIDLISFVSTPMVLKYMCSFHFTKVPYFLMVNYWTVNTMLNVKRK